MFSKHDYNFVSLIFQRQQHDTKGSFLYRLYGVVVHSGSLQGGHYTAYVRVRSVDVNAATAFLQKTFLDRKKMMTREELIQLVNSDLTSKCLKLNDATHYEDDQENQWFRVSDSSVNEIREEEVFKKEAYLLFYDRIF